MYNVTELLVFTFESELSCWSWSRPKWYVIHMVISDWIYWIQTQPSVHFRAMLIGKKGHVARPRRRIESLRVSLNII